jgi:diketogulonate reductase-like aldo/keto reductase
MKQIVLPGGESVPALGLGTWCIGDERKLRGEEIATLQLALDLGVRLIDTAEMYGEGRAESLIGEALLGRRDEAFIVSKVYPHNASRRDAVAACERSLKRLRTDRIDLYLLHWRGSVPLQETLEAFLALQAAGKIRHFGVSNFDLHDMREWAALDAAAATATATATATNQVLYNLGRRGVEWDLLPWQRTRGMPLMAYSPIEQGRLLRERKLIDFAARLGISPSQVALAWLLAQEDVIVIPKTGQRQRLRENLAAAEIQLDAAQLAELELLYPAPRGPVPLAML